jgi:FtsH-binding integral membrane protein
MDQSNFYSTKTKTVSYDAGLRSYMLYVYNYMAGALVLTGLVAMLTVYTNFISLLYTKQGMTGLGFVVTLAPIGILVAFGSGIQKMKLQTVQLLFWLYAALIGMSLSFLALIYTGESIAKTFFITASVFGMMSLYGYTTKKDLTGLGSFLMMALFGVILTSLVNMFMKSSGLQFILSLVTVFIFIGLTAYDTQKIKSFYHQANILDEDTAR